MPLQTQLGILTASTDAGGIALTNTQTLTIETVPARGGDVALRTTSGDLTILAHTVRATTGSVRLTAAGSILAGTPGFCMSWQRAIRSCGLRAASLADVFGL